MTLTTHIPVYAYLLAPAITAGLVALYVRADGSKSDPVWHALFVAFVIGILSYFDGLYNQYKFAFIIASTVLVMLLPAYFLTVFLRYCLQVNKRYRALKKAFKGINVRTDVPISPVRLWHCRNELEYERKVQQMKEDAFQVVSAQAQDQFIELVQKHFIVLTRKRSQSTYFDDYEVRQDDDWRKHIRYFIHSVAFPSIDTQGLITKPPVEWVAILNELVPYVPPETINLTMSDVLTGIDYESFVAGLFEDAGWTAQLTAVTGDHGADIIVSYGGVRVAVQCKLYSSPVGNDSVQEAHAAKGFYHCQLAMVISNADYTKAARQLASSLGVVLAHHDTALHKLNDLMQRSLQGAR